MTTAPIYWYDGTSTRPSTQHLALARLDDVKVRLGFVNSAGEQKGVDSLIVTDMIALARSRAMSDAVLLSSDGDSRVGVQQAQELGVRVHLIGIKPSRGSQPLFLLQEADTTHEWSETEVAPVLACRPKAEVKTTTPAAVPFIATVHTGVAVDPLERVATGLLASTSRPSPGASVAALFGSIHTNCAGHAMLAT